MRFLEARLGCHLWPQPCPVLSSDLRVPPQCRSLRPAPARRPETSCWALGCCSWAPTQDWPAGWLLQVSQLCLQLCSFRPREGTQDSGATRSKRALEDEGSTDALSKNKQRKQLRNPRKTFDPMLKRKLPLWAGILPGRWAGSRGGGLVSGRSLPYQPVLLPWGSWSRSGARGRLPDRALLGGDSEGHAVHEPCGQQDGGTRRHPGRVMLAAHSALLATASRDPSGDLGRRWQRRVGSPLHLLFFYQQNMQSVTSVETQR